MVLDTPKGNQPHQVMAEELRERSRKAGVPDFCLKSSAIGETREVTSSGSGSAAARLQGLMTLMNLVFPNTTQDRKINILRDLTANAMGGAKVDRYAPSLTDADMPGTEDSFAAVESSELSMGGDAVVSSKQNDAIHATGHLAKAQQIMQAVQQGQMDPAQALAGLQKLLAHSGEHLSRLQGNPTRKAEFDQLSEQWDEIAKFTQQLQNAVEAQQNQPDPEQQMSEEGQIAMRKVDLKNEVDNKKADASIARSFRKEAFHERISDRKQAFNIIQKSAAPPRNGSKPVAQPA